MDKLQSCHTTFGETSHPNVIVTALEILEPFLVSQETLGKDLKWDISLCQPITCSQIF